MGEVFWPDMQKYAAIENEKIRQFGKQFINLTRINNQSRTYMKRIIPLAIILGSMMQPCASGQEGSAAAAQWKTQCGTPVGQQKFPIAGYRELPQFTKPSEAEWKDVKGIMASWGNTDTRYAKTSVPMSRTCKLQGLSGWRGEKVHAQAVVWSKDRIERLRYELSEFRGPQGQTIPADRFETGFVRYVMTDELNEGGGGCGHRPDHTVYDSTMVADCIDHLLTETSLEPMNTQAIWISCRIPQDVEPGTYKGHLTVKDGNRTVGTLDLNIRADRHILPDPSQWRFHLDLWQNPYAVARYYQVPVWSQEHLDAMRPLMERLANAGQKVITASIMHKPWNGQTHDWFESMVTWIRKADGSWKFCFDIFDKWVEFMMSCGIDQEINCYSMVPWDLSFRYFDQATNNMAEVRTAPGEAEYEEMWTSMLKAFSRHLKEKGWFGICTIAMDERPMEVMRKTIEVIRKSDPDFKISLAGSYHPEIEDQLYDYCITINESFPEEVLERRRQEGRISTLYTCCTESYPNTFTFSPLAEATWIGYHMAARNVDGYLRWAYNSWPLEPLLDSRFRTWAAGDTYLVYPGNRTSMRMEKLIEGIQAYEKIMSLKKEYKDRGETAKLEKLENALADFELSDFPEIPASKTVGMMAPILK